MISIPFLAYMRATVAKFLTDTCTIERDTETTGQYGEPVHAFEVVASGVACRVIKAGQLNAQPEGLIGGQEIITDLYKLITARTVTLDIDYRVTVGGIVYSVVRLETELTSEGFHATLIARQR